MALVFSFIYCWVFALSPFVSWFICSRRWCIDKLGVFHAIKHICVLIHILTKGEVGPVKPVEALKWNISIDRSKAVLLLCIIHIISVLLLLCFSACLFIDALWPSAGKGLTSWLSFVMSYCEFVTFQLVSWVSCGYWLYRFLIFALFLILLWNVTLSHLSNINYHFCHVCQELISKQYADKI